MCFPMLFSFTSTTWEALSLRVFHYDSSKLSQFLRAKCCSIQSSLYIHSQKFKFMFHMVHFHSIGWNATGNLEKCASMQWSGKWRSTGTTRTTWTQGKASTGDTFSGDSFELWVSQSEVNITCWHSQRLLTHSNESEPLLETFIPSSSILVANQFRFVKSD